MYIALSVALIAFLAYLTITAESKSELHSQRNMLRLNLILSAAGLVLTAALTVITRLRLFGGSFDADFASWAWDMLSVYYDISFISCGTALLVLSLSALTAVFDVKQREGFRLKLRLITNTAFSVLMLAIPMVYAFMIENESIDLKTIIYATGLAQALVIRFPLLIDYALRIKNQKSI